MRIAVTGTANTGKTTLISDMVEMWQNYKSNNYTYRELLKQDNLLHSKQANKDTQWTILNNMVDELQKYTATDYVIFDRSPLDNLAYSLWAYDKGLGNIDDEFIGKCIPIVRESLRFLDIVFFTPITRASPIVIVEDGTRETCSEFIGEIDNILKSITEQYNCALEKSIIFPKDDCPGVIEIFGKREERIYLIKQYLNENGDLYGAEFDNALQFDEAALKLADLLGQQQDSNASENFMKDQQKMVGQFMKKEAKKTNKALRR